MKQKEALKKGGEGTGEEETGEGTGEEETGDRPQWQCDVPLPEYVTTHTARRSGITNMYLSHKFTIVQMMHVSATRHKRPSWTTSSYPPR